MHRRNTLTVIGLLLGCAAPALAQPISFLGERPDKVSVYSSAVNTVLCTASYQGTTWVGTPDGIKQVPPGRPIRLYTTEQGLAPGEVVGVVADAQGVIAAVAQVQPLPTSSGGFGPHPCDLTLCRFDPKTERWSPLAVCSTLASPSRLNEVFGGRGGLRDPHPWLLLRADNSQLYLASRVQHFASRVFIVARATGKVSAVALQDGEVPWSPVGMTFAGDGSLRLLSGQGVVFTLRGGELQRLGPPAKPVSPPRFGGPQPPQLTSAKPTSDGGFWAIRRDGPFPSEAYTLVRFGAQGEAEDWGSLPALPSQPSNAIHPSPPLILDEKPDGSLIVVRPPYSDGTPAQRSFGGAIWQFFPRNKAWETIPLQVYQDSLRPHPEWYLPAAMLPERKRFVPPPILIELDQQQHILDLRTTPTKIYPLPEALAALPLQTIATSERVIWLGGVSPQIPYVLFDSTKKSFETIDVPPTSSVQNLSVLLRDTPVHLAAKGGQSYDRTARRWVVFPLPFSQHGTLSVEPVSGTDTILIHSWQQNGQELGYWTGTGVELIGPYPGVQHSLADGDRLWLATATELICLKRRSEGGYRELRRRPLPMPRISVIYVGTDGALWWESWSRYYRIER